jgi:hypothetical protein
MPSIFSPSPAEVRRKESRSGFSINHVYYLYMPPTFNTYRTPSGNCQRPFLTLEGIGGIFMPGRRHFHDNRLEVRKSERLAAKIERSSDDRR